MSVFKLPGSAIQANTITTTQLLTTVVTQISAGGGPKVKSLIYPGNDTAANSTGGQTVYITGSGFAANAQVLVNGSAVPSQSFISASNISFTTPALSTGTYPVYIINPEDGGTAILYPGLLISGEPTWVTSAGSLSASQDELSSWSYSLSATGDTPITYALAAGNTLPTGISLAANGLISGTISSPTGNTTTYTFSVIATDAQNQDSTRQFTVTTSTGEGVLFANNVLLIHADGTNNGNNHSFLDSSNNNFTITRNGNATQGSFSPFSQTGWSGYFDGNGDYLSFGASGNTAYDIISGNFTVECWIYDQGSGAERYIFSNRGASSGWELRKNATNLLQFFFTGGSSLTSTSTITSNKWTHVAVTRNGNTVRIFIDGGLDASSTFADGSSGVASSLYIGYGTAGGGYFLGNISNARIIKGNALYTATFTPPTSALTAVANTSLLTCQSNRFIDNSNNNFTITRNGDTSIQAWSPFAPTAVYSTAAVGGSAYFDGTGDYLSYGVGNTSIVNWYSQSTTIEAWIYPTAYTTFTNGYGATFTNGDTSTNSNYWGFGINSNKLRFVYFGSSGTNSVESTGTVPLNAWTHIAFVYNHADASIKLFINGVLDGSGTKVGTPLSDANIGIKTGGWHGGYFSGYMSGVRMLQGTALYTASFAPPTAPLTNVANTRVLLSATNAQIFDQTAKNVLECIGDAKVSTAQYKYGTGSIYIPSTSDAVKMSGVDLLGDFTIEGWAKPSISGGEKFFIIQGVNLTNGFLIGLTTSEIRWRSNGQTDISAAISKSDWYHFAITRSGSGSNNVKVFVDGVQVTQGTYTNTILASAGVLNIGPANLVGSFASYGYIDDFRITKGYARYTANFTPPTSALKDK